MKRLLSIMLLIACFWSLPLSARRSVEAIHDAPALDASVQKMAGEYRDINTLVEKARRDAAQAKRKAQREIEQLHGRMNRRQSRLERRRQEVLRKEAEQRALLEQRTREQAEAVAKDAESEALKIIKSAEQKAVELRAKLQEQDKQDRAASRPRITGKWQREILSEYDTDISFMRRVIMEGEPSRIERQNFIALFDEQKKWLTDMVGKAEFFFDDSYAAVMKKKNGLSGLIDAQRQADEIILDLVDQHHLSEEVRAQLRLMALYELNNHIQSNNSVDVFLKADVIHELVNKVTGDVAPGQREIKVVTEKERIGSLEQRIAELEQQLAAQAEQDDDRLDGIDDDIAEKADQFDQKQDALTAGRQSSRQRIAELEKEKKETLASLEKKREEEVGSIKQQSEARIAELTKERDQMLQDHVHDSDDAAATLQEQIDELEKEKEDAVAKTEEISTLRIKELKRAHEQARKELHQQRERAVAQVRKQLDALKQEKAAAAKKLVVQELDLAGERAKAKQLSDQLADAQGAVSSLEGKVTALKTAQEALSDKHQQEQADFIKRIEGKQHEKATLEVQLGQVKQHLTVLTTQSSERLITLANKVSEQAVTQEDLARLLEQKNHERVDLEIAVAAAQEQLKNLSEESQEVLLALTDRLNWYERQCASLQGQLENKQAMTTELEALVNKMHATNNEVYNKALEMGQKVENLSSDRNALRDRVAHLQRALGALRQQQKLQGQQDLQIIQRARALTHQAQDEVARLTALLERQHRDLYTRRHAFERMQQLQGHLHALRDAREYDPVRDAQQAEVFSQMTSFGDQVLNNYASIDRAVHDTGQVYDELALLQQLFGGDQVLVSDDSLVHLDQALSTLGDTAQVSSQVPARPREEILYAPKKQQLSIAALEEEEEEEAPHEPDDHGDHPEEVEDLESETGNESIEDSVENFLSQDSEDAIPETDDTEPPEESAPEEMVAVAPGHDDGSDEEEDDDEEDDEDEEVYKSDNDDDDEKESNRMSDTVLDILSGDDDDGW